MTGYPRSEEEKKLIVLYARRVIAGEYESAAAAARACWREHERVRATRAVPPPPRSVFGFQLAIGIAARKQGRPSSAGHRWAPAELLAAERYARSLTDGEYKRLSDAVRACHAEMAGRRSPATIGWRIRRDAAGFGRLGVSTLWTDGESRIADRFARAVVDGQYPQCAAAADDCMRALEAAGMAGRTRRQVCTKLGYLALSLGYKPRSPRWSSEELAIIESYVRRLMNGEYHSGDEAARACVRSLAWAGFSPRSIIGVRHRVLSVARALGRECYAPRRAGRRSR